MVNHGWVEGSLGYTATPSGTEKGYSKRYLSISHGYTAMLGHNTLSHGQLMVIVVIP